MSFRYLMVAFALFFTTALFAQQIASQKDNGRAPYLYADGPLPYKSMLTLLETDPDTEALVRQGKSGRTMGSILGGIGGFIIGYEIGDALTSNRTGKEFNASIAGAGAALTVIGVLIGSSADKKFAEAVTIYNRNQAATGYRAPELLLEVGQTSHGVGLVLKF